MRPSFVLYISFVIAFEIFVFSTLLGDTIHQCKLHDCNNPQHDARLQELLQPVEQLKAKRLWEYQEEIDDVDGYVIQRPWKFHHQKRAWDDEKALLVKEQRACEGEKECEKINARIKKLQSVVEFSIALEEKIKSFDNDINAVKKIISMRDPITISLVCFLVFNTCVGAAVYVLVAC